METFVERCAGLDVHKDTVVATVRVPGRGGRRHQETETFPTHAAGLAELGSWLSRFEVSLVGMESTGVYWKPVYALLEDDFECWLLNAQHLRNVPGRKTDVADSAWIAQLLEHGLVRPSFVPPKPIRELRDLTRHRKALIEDRSRVAQRLDKVLQDTGVKLTSVASTLLTKSARSMLSALAAGERDPEALAELARGRLRSKIAQLRDVLAGRFSSHHGMIVTQLLAHLEFLDGTITELDERIEQTMAPFREVRDLVTTIPGVGQRTAEVLIAECGLDMGRFPSSAHLASWAGICPGHHESAGRKGSGHTRKGSRWLRKGLTEAAHAAARSRGTYLAAHHAQIRGRRGRKKAVGATRHDILVAYYHVVADRVAFRELGADWFARRFSAAQRTRRLIRQLEALGHRVALQPAAA
jgi:transposase